MKIAKNLRTKQTRPSDASSLVIPSLAPFPAPSSLPIVPLTISKVEKTRFRASLKQMDGPTDGQIYRRTNRWTDGPMDGWTNRRTDPLIEMQRRI